MHPSYSLKYAHGSIEPCFDVVTLVLVYVHIFLRIVSLILWRSYDCHRANEEIMKNITKTFLIICPCPTSNDSLINHPLKFEHDNLISVRKNCPICAIPIIDAGCALAQKYTWIKDKTTSTVDLVFTQKVWISICPCIHISTLCLPTIFSSQRTQQWACSWWDNSATTEHCLSVSAIASLLT